MSRSPLFLTSALVLVTLTAARRLDDHELSSITRRKVKDVHGKPSHIISRTQRLVKELEKSDFLSLLDRVAKYESSNAGLSQTSTAEPSTTSSDASPSAVSSHTSTAEPSTQSSDASSSAGPSHTSAAEPSTTSSVEGCSDVYNFRCLSGYCISENSVCDGVDDCPGGFDEQGCDATSSGPSHTSAAEPSTTSSGPVENNLACGELPAKDIIVPKRIVGGAEAKAHDWPSICSLHDLVLDSHFCGGTLVKNNKGRFFVISAAHCMWKCSKWDWSGKSLKCVEMEDPLPKEEFAVVCGIHNIRKGDTPDNSQVFKVAKYTNHENYDNKKLNPDITIIELDHQPSENRHVQAACLASSDHYPGEPAMVAGWGTLEFKGDSPDVLHELYKPIDNDTYCEETYKEYNDGGLDTDRDYNMCAGHREGGKDSCQGDSGGPLYTRRNNKWTLTGIVSWGEGCAKENFVGVYADVNSLRGWIDSKINE